MFYMKLDDLFDKYMLVTFWESLTFFFFLFFKMHLATLGQIERLHCEFVIANVDCVTFRPLGMMLANYQNDFFCMSYY